ncbi:hypothetical protein LTR36_006377 [Oleoguttula mirabilis]|uniref:Uncharacterized protein n=1 Tax=Oleoguttula mirabilis TaxID=1507867 RepID=A0AAV9JWD1_9PEZI|nr:hypothetical protein LTR36_006377 [Oleoguttula mirabilis]
MAGFTPINAAVQQEVPATQTSGGEQATSSTTRSRPKTVAAEYLGCGETEQAAPVVSQALHGPGTKKATGKGKKRASTTSAASKAKRRKSNDVSDSMSVSKGSAHQQEDAQQAPKAAKAKTKRKATVPNTDQDAADTTETTRPLPVYAPATTVGSLHSRPQTTSLDGVRAASGYGHTVYNGGLTPITVQTGIKTTQPQLNNASEDHSVAARSSTRHRRTSVVQPSKLAPVEEEDDLDMIIESLPSQVSRKTVAGKRQLPTPVNSDPGSLNIRKQPSRKSKEVLSIQTDEDFLELVDTDDDDAMADLAEAVEETAVRRERTPPPRTVKQNTRAVDEYDDYGGALFSEAEKQLLDELRASTQDSTNKRIVRKSFPPPVLDRSPIFGATNGTVLRTCFRVGEALNVGCHAVRTNKNVMLELYARVTSSWREGKPGRKQHFVFQDMYHDKQPHVSGTFGLWDQSRLWELDSTAFLVPRKEGIMCRVIARMRRDGLKWRLEMLSIWEASWEDVDFVAGIYAKEEDC